MDRVQNVLNDFRVRDAMQPELIEQWLRERLDWEFRAAENDALDRAAEAVEDLRFGGHILEAALGKKAILALKHPSN